MQSGCLRQNGRGRRYWGEPCLLCLHGMQGTSHRGHLESGFAPPGMRWGPDHRDLFESGPGSLCPVKSAPLMEAEGSLGDGDLAWRFTNVISLSASELGTVMSVSQTEKLMHRIMV